MVIKKLKALTDQAGLSPSQVGKILNYGDLEHGPRQFMRGEGGLSIPNAEKLALALGHEIRVVKKDVTPMTPSNRQENASSIGEKQDDSRSQGCGGLATGG